MLKLSGFYCNILAVCKDSPRFVVNILVGSLLWASIWFMVYIGMYSGPD